MGTLGLAADRSAAVLPLRVAHAIAMTPPWRQTEAAAWATRWASVGATAAGVGRANPDPPATSAIRTAVCVASIGYAPIAVSADSMMASVPSKTALATSLTS